MKVVCNIFEMLNLVKFFVLLYNGLMPLETKIARILTRKGKTLAVAESCTGGLLSHRLTNISGSSKFFKLGVVTYSNDAKAKMLGISAKVIKKYGAVSREVASAMAAGVRKKARADFGVGISGIAGPTGGTKEKPVGLVFIAVSGKKSNINARCLFKGSRLRVKTQAVTHALKLILELAS